MSRYTFSDGSRQRASPLDSLAAFSASPQAGRATFSRPFADPSAINSFSPSYRSDSSFPSETRPRHLQSIPLIFNLAMKPTIRSTLLLLLTVFSFTACTATQRAHKTINLAIAGDGIKFTGFYIQNGKTIPVTAVMPWEIQAVGITQFEFRKANPSDICTCAVNREGERETYTVNSGPGDYGVRGKIGRKILLKTIQ